MANKDVTQTLAGRFPSSILSEKEKKALICLFKVMSLNATYTKPTNAQWDAFVASANSLLPKPQATPLDSALVAVWFQAEINAGGSDLAQSTTKLSQLRDAVAHLMPLDMNTLEALDVYLEGRLLAVLT